MAMRLMALRAARSTKLRCTVHIMRTSAEIADSVARSRLRTPMPKGCQEGSYTHWHRKPYGGKAWPTCVLNQLNGTGKFIVHESMRCKMLKVSMSNVQIPLIEGKTSSQRRISRESAGDSPCCSAHARAVQIPATCYIPGFTRL